MLFSLDTSGSIKNDNFERIMLFAEAVATDLPIDGDARVALQTFANDAKVKYGVPRGSVLGLVLFT